MHGAGNSFIIIENLHDELQGEDLAVLALLLCDTKTGIGADGMIVLVPSGNSADFGMLFYNADGSLGEMCGNGARCIARYGLEHRLSSDPDNIRILATAGLVTGRRITEDEYEIRLNDPTFVDLNCKASAGDRTVDCFYVELGMPGIPHAVVKTDKVMLSEPDALRRLAVSLRYSSAFSKGANVTFFAFDGESRIRAITYERGVEDFTLACGTGCGAAAVSLILSGAVTSEYLDILMPGGLLHVHIRRRGDIISDILLTGPTAVVHEGEFRL